MLDKLFYGFLLFFLCCFKSLSYSYEHLPLCESLQLSFPKINATCFIIVNQESNIILNEKNSSYKILFNDNKHKKSLHDIVSSCDNFTSTSQVSGMTFVFSYKNKYGIIFKIALSGINTDELFEEDRNNISEWLDQFFLFKVCKKNAMLAKIPVIYGKNLNNIDMVSNEDIFTILSAKQNNKIVKTVIYKSVISAPFNENTSIGSVALSTKTFVNPFTVDIKTTGSDKRAGKCKVLMDSIRCLIFGPSFNR